MHAPDSPEAARLIDRAERLTASADGAFRRYFTGEVRSSSAASRLQNQADEAWADVRLYIKGGDEIEWERLSAVSNRVR